VPSTSFTHVRLLSLGGLLITVAMVVLGAIWPSYFTIVAIPVTPAPLTFGAFLFRPELASKWPKVCVYLAVCVAISAASLLVEFVWLSSH